MKATLVIFLLLLFLITAYPQATVTDSTPTLQNIFSTLSKTSLKDNFPLYSGRQYLRFSQNITGHPFFLNERPFTGSVFCGGIVYDSVLLYYDIYLDKLIANNYSNDNQLILPTEKVESFYISGRRFVQLNVAESGRVTENLGFAEVAYQGKRSKIYIKHQKTLPMDNSTGDERRKFKEKNYFYIEINNHLHAANSKKQLLSALGNKRKEAANFIAANKLSYQKNEVELLTRVAAFYDSLIN